MPFAPHDPAVAAMREHLLTRRRLNGNCRLNDIGDKVRTKTDMIDSQPVDSVVAMSKQHLGSDDIGIADEGANHVNRTDSAALRDCFNDRIGVAARIIGAAIECENMTGWRLRYTASSALGSPM